MGNCCRQNLLPPQNNTTGSYYTRPIFNEPSCIKFITTYLRYRSWFTLKFKENYSTPWAHLIFGKGLCSSPLCEKQSSLHKTLHKTFIQKVLIILQELDLNWKQWGLFHSHMESSQICQEGKLDQKKEQFVFI